MSLARTGFWIGLQTDHDLAIAAKVMRPARRTATAATKHAQSVQRLAKSVATIAADPEALSEVREFEGTLGNRLKDNN